MSLILDALKKSEAERRRGLPPGLSTPFGAPRRRARAPWVAGASVVLLAAGLAGGFVLLGRTRVDAPRDLAADPAVPKGANSSAGPGASSMSPPVSGLESSVDLLAVSDSAKNQSANVGGSAGAGDGGSVSGGGLAVPQRAVLFTPSTTPEPQVATQPLAPPVIPAAAAVDPGKDPVEIVQSTPPGIPAPMIPVPAIEAPAASTGMASSTQINAPVEGLLSVHQLPYTLRKDLPKLTLSMHVYSPIREERFIVLNGKRFAIDSPPPGPDLNLLDIVDDGAVLEFRGQRFLLPRQSY